MKVDKRGVVKEIDVKALREKKGLTQAQLAAALGVTVTTVSRWEVSHAMPRGSALVLLRQLAAT